MDEKKLEESRQTRISNAWMCVAGVVTVTVILLNVPFVSWLTGAPPDGPGTFGDSFGGLTSFFSAASFCLLIYSLIIQRRDSAEAIRLAKEELIATKLDIARNSLPFLIVKTATSDNIIKIEITNVGAEVFNVKCHTSPYVILAESFPFLDRSPRIITRRVTEEFTTSLFIAYTTHEGRSITESFQFAVGFNLTISSRRTEALEELRKELRGQI